jgi:hypothetical protein
MALELIAVTTPRFGHQVVGGTPRGGVLAILDSIPHKIFPSAASVAAQADTCGCRATFDIFEFASKPKHGNDRSQSKGSVPSSGSR